MLWPHTVHLTVISQMHLGILSIQKQLLCDRIYEEVVGLVCVWSGAGAGRVMIAMLWLLLVLGVDELFIFIAKS